MWFDIALVAIASAIVTQASDLEGHSSFSVSILQLRATFQNIISCDSIVLRTL